MRHVKDSDVAGPADGTSDQIVIRGSYAMFEDRLTVRATREQSLPGRNANPDFPSRTVLGEDNGGLFDGAGLRSESFTAVSFGSALETEAGTVTGRAEARFGSDERWNVVVGHYLAPYDNLSFANRLRFLHEAPDAGTEATTAALQLGLAYRPADGPLILSRLDIGFERDPLAEAETGTAHGTWKIVNNTIVNLAPRPDLQVSLQLGLKYAVDVFDARLFHSFSALTGAEARYDLSDRFDLGLRAATSLRLPAGTLPYALGPSLGYSISETTWLSAGCNLIGFEDEDFSAAGYTAAGPFVQFRMRLDPSDAAQLARWLASD